MADLYRLACRPGFSENGATNELFEAGAVEAKTSTERFACRIYCVGN
ncbi:MAG: hypothetical protein ABI977_11225 [Acidobacteriota bacterium]